MLFGEPVTTALILLFIAGSVENFWVSFASSSDGEPSQAIDIFHGTETPTSLSQRNGSSFLITGRINSMLMPTTADTSNDLMNNSMVMLQMMNNSSTTPSAATDPAASRAM